LNIVIALVMHERKTINRILFCYELTMLYNLYYLVTTFQYNILFYILLYLKALDAILYDL